MSSSPPTNTVNSSSTPTTSPSAPTELRQIPLTLIDEPQANNGRIERDQDKLTELQHTIAADGLINPITVRTSGSRYELIAGAGRLECYRRLNRPTIPATILIADDLRAATLRLAENYARSDLSPVEEAAQLADLVETHPDAVDGVARIVNHRVDWVLDRLDILQWPDALQHAVHARQISLAAARILARIPDPDTRTLRIADATRHGINASTAALWLQHAQGELAPSAPPSDFSGQSTDNAYQTTTTACCFGCQNRQHFADLTNRLLCSTCSTAITTASAMVAEPATGPQKDTTNPERDAYDAYHLR